MVISIQLGDGWSLMMVIPIQLGDVWSLRIETDTWLFRYSWVMDGV